MTSPINSSSKDSGQFSNEYACSHNNREGVSVMDVVEHVAKAEFATAARETADAACGYEKFSGFNQEPPKNDSPSKDSNKK